MARILIADDDEQAIEIVRAALEERGHIVGALDDGTGVKRVVEFKQPDLVILIARCRSFPGSRRCAKSEIRLQRSTRQC